jgi:hypothetical protein
MSAAGDLLKQSTASVLLLVARYWLLVSRPDLYFDEYIKDKKAEDLGEVIRHFLLAATAVTLVFGAAFALKASTETVSPFVKLVLTKQYPLFVLMVFLTTPPLLLFYVVYRLIRASISDLAFIYLSVLTVWVILCLCSNGGVSRIRHNVCADRYIFTILA